MIFAEFKWVILLLIVPFLAWAYGVSYMRRRRLLRSFSVPERWRDLVPSWSGSRIFWKRLLVLVALLFLILAIMRPQWGVVVEKVARKGLDVLIVLDTSKSMLAQDVSPSRFDHAKQEILGLMDRLKGDRIGLMVFSGTAFMQVPYTLDHDILRLVLSDLEVGVLPRPGTDLATAVKKGRLSFLKGRKQKLMVIYTDGESFETDPVKSAELARDLGVRIFTVGIGSSQGEPIPVRSSDGAVSGYKKDVDGNVIVSRLNEPVLKKVAEVTGGRYFFSGQGNYVADYLYRLFNEQEQESFEDMVYQFRKDRYQWFVLIVLVLLLVEFMISERRRQS